MEQTITILGASPYERVREICHGVKHGNPRDIDIAGRHLALTLPGRALLLPVPGHRGRAVSTLLLARCVASYAKALGKRVRICDGLRCHPHESAYERKKRGLRPLPVDARWQNPRAQETVTRLVGKGYIPIVVDNVVDTGSTVRSFLGLTGGDTVLACGETGNHLPQRHPDREPDRVVACGLAQLRLLERECLLSGAHFAAETVRVSGETLYEMRIWEA